MDIERLRQRLNNYSSKLSVNKDTFLKIGINTKERLLPNDDINKIVNQGDRFNTERNNSSFYRILGTINPVATNALFNLNDTLTNNANTWAGFNDIKFLDKSYPTDGLADDTTDYTYTLSLKNNLKEKDGWFGFFNPIITDSALCYYYDVEPKRERFSFIPDIAPFHPTNSQISEIGLQVKNWELTVSYPAETDKNHTIVKNGLQIVEAVSTLLGNRTMVAIGMSCKHNLVIGDLVKISGTTGYDGTHVVVRTGLENGDLKEYYFVVDLPPTGTVSSTSRIKKIINGIESEYYFRLFKKIKTRNTPIIETDDYETYGLAFSENIYTDRITQFVFNEDIDVSDLVDNLGRPLSELYLTIIKTNSNDLFSKVSSGLETPLIQKINENDIHPYIKEIPSIHKIHNGGNLPFISHTPLENDVMISNNLFYGDLVEYNINILKETVLSEVHHRFNTLNRETAPVIASVSGLGNPSQITNITLGPRQEGYYYKAHQLIKIREFSSYIETGDVNTADMPSYVVNMGDGRYVWRDLLDIGFNENDIKLLDYPFLNGCHYMYDNYSFKVKRQDPFNNWDLFYTNFPADPLGQKITDKFTTNSSDNDC